MVGTQAAPLDFKEVRGLAGIKEATYRINGADINVAVASGIGNAKRLIEERIETGEKTYHFVEIMGCPGGCINGGGQPVQPASVRNSVDLTALRAAALYSEDEAKTLRRSHESPVVQKIYEEYLEAPGSLKAHHLLHTSYHERMEVQ